MKLHDDNFPVQVSGADSGTSQFSIAMNAKAFRVLSDTLYQDKIGSLVREISTNAYDGHIMAGNKDEAFQIHLPDNFEPWFSVRDFGVGLSPESIRQVYTTYFMSTKDQSNETVGAFGLGAKTPFAYTDQFTITSVFDGRKTIYSAFIDGSGIPNIAEMHSEESSDRNGVEVKVAVKQQDFSAFKNAVAFQLRFFKVKPEIINCDNFQFTSIIEPNKSSIVSDDYVITPSYSELIAIQGQIGYVVDRNKILNAVADNKEIRALLVSALSIKINFPIGHIGVTASRENIEYDDRTVNNIIQKLISMYKDVQQTAEERLEEAKTVWEKVCLVRGMYSHFKAAAKIEFPNLIKTINNDYQFDLSGLPFLFNSTSRRYGSDYFYRISTKKLTPHDNLAIVLVNCSRPLTYVLDKVYRENKENTMITIFIDKKANVEEIKKTISEYLGGFDNFYLHSDYVVKQPRAARVVVSQPKTTQYLITSSGGKWNRAHESELPDEFVYVEAQRGNVKNFSDYDLIKQFFNLKKIPELSNTMNLPLLAIPVSEMKKLKDSGGVPLADFIEKVKKDVCVKDIEKMLRKVKLLNVAKVFSSAHSGNVRNAIKQSGVKYGKMIELAEKAVLKYRNLEFIYTNDVAEMLNIKIRIDNEHSHRFHDKIKSKHPILKISDWDLRSLSEDELVKLIKVTN